MHRLRERLVRLILDDGRHLGLGDRTGGFDDRSVDVLFLTRRKSGIVSILVRGCLVDGLVVSYGVGLVGARLDKTVEGSGIGLATCRRIVEAHGGSMGVEPREGGGSTFWFELPVVDGVGSP
jgi:hypothetical protein